MNSSLQNVRRAEHRQRMTVPKLMLRVQQQQLCHACATRHVQHDVSARISIRQATDHVLRTSIYFPIFDGYL